jgi:hypothetical protein
MGAGGRESSVSDEVGSDAVVRKLAQVRVERGRVVCDFLIRSKHANAATGPARHTRNIIGVVRRTGLYNSHISGTNESVTLQPQTQ